MDNIVNFLDKTVYEIIDRPDRFGGYYAVELQVLRLLETRLVHLNPNSNINLVQLFYQSMESHRLVPSTGRCFVATTIRVTPPTWRDRINGWFKYKALKEFSEPREDRQDIKLHTRLRYNKEEWQIFMRSFVARSWSECLPLVTNTKELDEDADTSQLRLITK